MMFNNTASNGLFSSSNTAANSNQNVSSDPRTRSVFKSRNAGSSFFANPFSTSSGLSIDPDLDAALASTKSLNKHIKEMKNDLYSNYGISKSKLDGNSAGVKTDDDELFKLLNNTSNLMNQAPYQPSTSAAPVTHHTTSNLTSGSSISASASLFGKPSYLTTSHKDFITPNPKRYGYGDDRLSSMSTSLLANKAYSSFNLPSLNSVDECTITYNGKYDYLNNPQNELNDFYKLASRRSKMRTNYSRQFADENISLNPLLDNPKYIANYDLNTLIGSDAYASIGSASKKSWFDEPVNQFVPLSKRNQLWRPKTPTTSFNDRFKQTRRMSYSETKMHPQLMSAHYQNNPQSSIKELESLNKRTSELLMDLNKKFQLQSSLK